MSPAKSVCAFLAATFALTWVCQTPGVLSLRNGVPPGMALMFLMAVGSCGPSLVARLMSRVQGGPPLLRRSARASWLLVLVGLFYPMASHLVGSAALVLAGNYSANHVVYPPLLPEQIAIAIIAPLGEEFGWRGYALPRLQSITTPLKASVLIGVAWTVWHLPTYFVPGASVTDMFLGLPAMVASSIVYTWLYNRSGGSMLVMVMAHAGAHLDNVFRAAAMGDGWKPMLSTSVVMCVVAVLIVVTGRLRVHRPVTQED